MKTVATMRKGNKSTRCNLSFGIEHFCSMNSRLQMMRDTKGKIIEMGQSIRIWFEMAFILTWMKTRCTNFQINNSKIMKI